MTGCGKEKTQETLQKKSTGLNHGLSDQEVLVTHSLVLDILCTQIHIHMTYKK